MVVGLSPPQEPLAAVMPEMTYAIGDIHGRLDLLERADRLIAAHAAERSYQVICLGDYVDRGPDSAGVIAFLMRAEQEGRYLCLKGNHEEMMVEGAAGEGMDFWLDNGGDATLASYGGVLSLEHLKWAYSLPIRIRDDYRIYVHAGLMPDLAYEDQDDATCLWIRGRFLTAPASAFPAHVVHGHTPSHADKRVMDQPELLPHRTNLDTGACLTGVLSVGVFESDAPGGPIEILRVTNPRRPWA